jgi:tRNA-splicing ligase RtcB
MGDMTKTWEGRLQKLDDCRWMIPQDYKSGMRVPGIIYADELLLKDISKDQAIEQVANVATLPGIVHAALAMPDIHWGYGFPIGGVCATDPEGGVVSPGGIGYDINCGIRLVKSNLHEDEVRPKLEELIQSLFREVPSGVGSRGSINVPADKMEDLLTNGAQWPIDQGYGWAEDLAHIEERGAIAGADASKVSTRAMERGKNQLGTLGSGNHFLEVQVIDEVYDEATAKAFGLEKGMVTMMIHSGSRGLGYQICEDHLRTMGHALSKYDIYVPDRQLVCAPIHSPEGQAYLKAMRCGANFAWANRQCLMHQARKAFSHVFRKDPKKLEMSLVYDVAHNIAKFEEHEVNGEKKKLCVHRKGATRAFPPYHSELPAEYQNTGQPVIIPGDMGRNSYVLAGVQGSMTQTFGTTCHGAGRLLSRKGAKKDERSKSLLEDLKKRGIIVKVSGRETLSEEAPYAYKDVNHVVAVVDRAGISKKVCRMRPMGVVKG